MRNEVHGEKYRKYPLRQCEIKEKNIGFYREPLCRINDLFCYCRENYSKTLYIWFELKFPTDSRFAKRNDNEVLCRFIEALRKYYKEKYPMQEFHQDGRRRIPLPLYLWARELSITGQYHYHVTIVLNGQVIQKPHFVLAHVKKLWAGCINRAALQEDEGKRKDLAENEISVDSNRNSIDIETEFFSPEIIPVEYGYNKYRNLENYKESPFDYGAYRIDHYQERKDVLARYDALYEFFSYYAKIYSKSCCEEFSQPRPKDPSRKPKNFSCSQIPRYRETVREIDERMRLKRRE
ncbi:YagK/YfjJ domain-containing protein [Desulfopila aestuarii]|uniref:YagK/YfjJ C-terminal domain-containing protein n=1 Tax=Desulfopila aestuarii DSM 18488 TaxID=1121416 RepID=A0A1M7YCS5_9BACT|nr:inovirus-type Gp2 protein [Desulfopila aestuarii]SHO50425.1 Protein of unknown function [Desulfopila aestuarii DSM 18488]